MDLKFEISSTVSLVDALLLVETVVIFYNPNKASETGNGALEIHTAWYLLYYIKMVCVSGTVFQL